MNVREQARVLGEAFNDALRTSFVATCESWLRRLERLHGGKVGFRRFCRLWPCTDEAWHNFLLKCLGNHADVRKANARLDEAAVMQEKLRSASERAKQGETCWVCDKALDSFNLCAGCKLARYCSVSCQTSHWKAGHKRICSDFGRRRQLIDFNYRRPHLKHCNEHGLNEHVDLVVLHWVACSPRPGCSLENFHLHLEAVRQREWWLFPAPSGQTDERKPPFTTTDVTEFSKLCNYFAGESDRSRLSTEDFSQQWYPGGLAPTMTRQFFLTMYECNSIGETEADQVHMKEQLHGKFYSSGAKYLHEQLLRLSAHQSSTSSVLEND